MGLARSGDAYGSGADHRMNMHTDSHVTFKGRVA